MSTSIPAAASPTRLSVNVNKVATLRNARGGLRPDPVAMALLALDAGAHGITVHPRPDGRHIRHDDVYRLRAALPGHVELNIEGYPNDELIDLVLAVQPDQCTLVPDPPGVLTSNAGWRLDRDSDALDDLRRGIDRLHAANTRAANLRVSLFIDPEPHQIDRARELGANRIELYTEAWARAFTTPQRDATLATYANAAAHALQCGLGVNAGHDLDLDNLTPFARAVPGLLEVSIGHALIADALIYGLADTVQRYLRCLDDACRRA